MHCWICLIKNMILIIFRKKVEYKRKDIKTMYKEIENKILSKDYYEDNSSL